MPHSVDAHLPDLSALPVESRPTIAVRDLGYAYVSADSLLA